MTIVSYNFYYARSGNAAAVLEQRLRASDVRAKLGLPRGRTISRIEGDAGLPDVIWRLEFADMESQDADMEARAASPEFEAIRHGMRQLYRRFERPLYKPCGMGTAAPGASLLLYGVYAAAGSALAATGAALADVAAMARISGGRHVPDFIGETGSAGWPPAVLEQLERVHARVERSVWRVADRG